MTVVDAAAGSPPSATPRVDAVLRHPLATPPAVAGWLRACERRLLALRADVDAALGASRAAGHDGSTELSGAAEEIGRVLDDRDAGALARLLRRPLRQLVPGSPAAAAFDRLIERLSVRAERAIVVRPVVTEAAAELRALHDAFAARLPTLLARELDEAAIVSSIVERLRTIGEAKQAVYRLQAVTRRMREWDRDGAGDEGTTECVPAAGERLNGRELRAIVRRGLDARNRLIVARNPAPTLRTVLSRHADEAAASSAASRDEGDGLASIVRELLLTAARLGDVNDLAARDAALWSWTLNGASPGHRAAWTSGDTTHALPRRDEPPPAATTTLYVVPLDVGPSTQASERPRESRDTLVWISPHVPSVVRVWDATVAVGATVQARVVAPPTDTGDPVTDADLSALFAGVDARRSAWYATQTRARLEVIARCGDAWIARVAKLGSLQQAPTAVWRSESESATAFRILRPAAPSRRGHALVEDVDVLGEAGRPLGSVATLEVRTGLAGDGRAWLRTIDPDDAGGRLVLERERALFDEMARRSQHARFGLTPIASARRRRMEVPLPLYRRPLATGPGFGQLAPAWLRTDAARVAMIAAIARALTAVHAAGAALGLVHPDAFAYALEYLGTGVTLMPHAIVAYAPCATPLDQRYDRTLVRMWDSSGGEPKLPRLRVSALTDASRGGRAATRGDDATAFLRCALDVLVRDPLRASPDDGASWTSVVATHHTSFAALTLAKHIADLLDGRNDEVMVRVLDVIAAGGRDSAATLGIDDAG